MRVYHIKKDKRSQQSSEWIIQALAECMEKKAYQDISVVEVAQKAGVARATFYRNFDAMEDVLRLECDRAFDALRLQFIDHYQTADGTDAKSVFIRPLLRFWDTRTDIIQRLIQANRITFIQDAIARTIEYFLSLRATAEEDLWHRVDYFIAKRAGEASGILIHWVKNNKDIPADELAELIMLQTRKSLHLTLKI